MPTLHAAIVGAGLMGRWHAYYARQAGARVVAIVDRDPAAAASLQKRHPHARLASSVDDCLRDTAFDTAHVCTPVSVHRAQILALLNAGRHVIVEKPVAESVNDAREFVETASAARVELIPSHQFPFQSGFRTLLRNWTRLGDVVQFEFRASSAGGSGANDEERKALLLSILVHPLSLLMRCGLAQAVRDADVFVSSHELRIESPPDDGRPGVSIALSLRGRPTRNELFVTGTNASAYVDFFHGFTCFERGLPSRAAKAARPFLSSGARLVAASTNLGRRLVGREPAYPGLAELIRQSYRQIKSGNGSAWDTHEIVEIAAITEAIGVQIRAGRARGTLRDWVGRGNHAIFGVDASELDQSK